MPPTDSAPMPTGPGDAKPSFLCHACGRRAWDEEGRQNKGEWLCGACVRSWIAPPATDDETPVNPNPDN